MLIQGHWDDHPASRPIGQASLGFYALVCQVQPNRILWMNGFSWYFCRILVGQYVTVHGEVVSHVNITQVSVQDGGLYTCEASNRAGSASHSARLNIYGKMENWHSKLFLMEIRYSRPTPCPPTWRTSGCCWQRVFRCLPSQRISNWQDNLDQRLVALSRIYKCIDTSLNTLHKSRSEQHLHWCQPQCRILEHFKNSVFDRIFVLFDFPDFSQLENSTRISHFVIETSV